MVKSRSWIVKLLLLCSWSWLVPNGNWGPQHRGMGYDSQENSWGTIITFILYVAVNEFGNYLDKNPGRGYACPLNCGVDHKHISITKALNGQRQIYTKKPIIMDIADGTEETQEDP